MKTLQLSELRLALGRKYQSRDLSKQRISSRRSLSYQDLGFIPLFVEGVESVAVLSVYLDESYGKGKPDLIVGGFVSDIEQWAEFASLWKTEVQERFRIPYLHMKELMSGNSRLYRHLTSREKMLLFWSAVAIAVDCADLAVVCSINPAEYEAITTQDERSFHGSAYTVAVSGCLQAIKFYLGEKEAGITLDVFLEDGHRNANQALGFLQEEWRAQQGLDGPALSDDSIVMNQESFEEQKRTTLQYGVIALGTKAQMRPLQAADLLAYSMFKSSLPFFENVLSLIKKKVPTIVFPISPENVRESLDNHRRELEYETWARNQLSRAVGTVGGKVRRVGRGFVVHFDNPSEETHRVLVEALLKPRIRDK